MTKRKLVAAGLGVAALLAVAITGYAVVQTRSNAILQARHPLPPSTVAAAAAPEDIAAGGRLVAVAGCQLCHGRDLAGAKPGAFIAGRLGASNLTLIAAERSDAELDRAIRHGLNADGTSELAMPAYAYARFTDQETGQILGYLRSLRPNGAAVAAEKPTPGLRLNLATGRIRTQVERLAAARPALDLGPTLEAGRHMAAIACSQCHGADLGGGRGLPGPDLTVRNYYNRAQFHELMGDGVILQGSSELMQAAAKAGFSRLTAEQVDALYDYLLARDLQLAKARPPAD